MAVCGLKPMPTYKGRKDRMNKMMRRKKNSRPYQPGKRKPPKRRPKVWNGVIADVDRYYAGIDPRQLAFVFHPPSVTSAVPWVGRVSCVNVTNRSSHCGLCTYRRGNNGHRN